MIRFYVINRLGRVVGPAGGFDTIEEANEHVSDLARAGVNAYVDAHEPGDSAERPASLLDRVVAANRRRAALRSAGVSIR
jgi:hypothetical protein